jgi:hypothetical protein
MRCLCCRRQYRRVGARISRSAPLGRGEPSIHRPQIFGVRLTDRQVIAGLCSLTVTPRPDACRALSVLAAVGVEG